MIIDETFMWLYLAYKFTAVAVAAFVGCGFASLIVIPMYFEPMGESDRIALKVWKISAFVIPVSLFIALITPSENELKAYAFYAISKDVTTCDETKRLFDAAINYIEGNARKGQSND